MNDFSKEIINRLSSIAARVFPNKEGKVYLYGSRARGEARNDSDWDVLVLTKVPADSQETYDRFVFPFAEVGWYVDAEIIPINYSEEEWEARKGTPFYQNVMRDAILL